MNDTRTMNKISLSLLLLFIGLVPMWAQTVSFSSGGTDGKTLVVTASGDLTNYSQEYSTTSTQFTADAAGNVFTNNTGTSVAEGDIYDVATTYYTAERTWKQLYNGGAPTTDWTNVNETSTVWDDTKIADVYVYQAYYASWNQSVTINSERITSGRADLNTKMNIDGVDYSQYVFSTQPLSYGKVIAKSDLETSGVSLKRLGDMANYTQTTYKVISSNLYISTDAGNYKQLLTNGTTYTYHAGETFYTPDAITYTAIDDNAIYFADHSSYIREVTTTTTKTFIEALKDEINAGNYEKVVFENTGSDALTITDAIVRAILYPGANNAANANLTELDLGATTLPSLSASTFYLNGEQAYMLYHVKLASITLPLVPAADGKVSVPAQVATPWVGNTILKTITVPEGYTEVGANAFSQLGNSVSTFNLPSSLLTIGDNAFQNTASLKAITFPENLTTIGKKAFVGTNLESLTLPASLRTIDDEAFEEAKNLNEIVLNQGLEYIGNCAFSLSASNNKQEVLQIPASVQYIGPAAFNNRMYKDIYFQGSTAPIMPLGDGKQSDQMKNVTAFSDICHMGNNGFTANSTFSATADDASKGYANRENYNNGNTYFTLLHFPTGLTEEQAATYNDVTHTYLTENQGDGFDFSGSAHPMTIEGSSDSEESRTFNGNSTVAVGGKYNQVAPGYVDTYHGAQIVWPSQSQWMRSFIMSSLGYNWNGVDKYRPQLTVAQLKLYARAGYLTAEQLSTLTDGKDDNQKIDPETISDADLKSLYDNLQLMAYVGTRQFVLGNADVQPNTPDYTIDIKGGQWWTLCVPFNMTKKMIDEVFGPGTHVCRFSAVDRDATSNPKNITLRFQKDVYVHKFVKDAKGDYTATGEETQDDDIVIYAHQSYMVYPTKTDEDAVFVVRFYKPETGSPYPTIIEANADKETEDHTEYRFIGNYVANTKIPQYSYMYAKKKTETAYKFWFNTSTKLTWKPNKCVVQATAKDGGMTDNASLFTTANQAKQFSIFGEFDDVYNDTVTALDHVTIIAGEGKNAQVVYNLNGQIVNGNNLSRGIYIQNGKKFIVK